jgi:hypothetical protein
LTISINITPVIDRGSECFYNGALREDCLIREFCPQIPGYISNVALILLIAYVVIDLLIPEFFTRVLPRLNLSSFYAHNPKIPDIRLDYTQFALIRWLKARLWWAFAVFCLYVVMLLK